MSIMRCLNPQKKCAQAMLESIITQKRAERFRSARFNSRFVQPLFVEPPFAPPLVPSGVLCALNGSNVPSACA